MVHGSLMADAHSVLGFSTNKATYRLDRTGVLGAGFEGSGATLSAGGRRMRVVGTPQVILPESFLGSIPIASSHCCVGSHTTDAIVLALSFWFLVSAFLYVLHYGIPFFSQLRS